MNFFHSYISPKCSEFMGETLRSGWVSEGVRVREFEEQLASCWRFANPVATNSGTSALHLCLTLIVVGPGDEVILPTQTFVATGLAILYTGATPVFADIDASTGNISVDSIRSKITPRTKAILPVHWGGLPCDLEEINNLAKAHNLAVIEDAAHAFGATYKEKAIGSISRFTAFSFQATKILSCGDGGALCCLDEEDHTRARAKRWFGIPKGTGLSELGERNFDLTEVGFKYHMNDVAASIGLGNLCDLPKRLRLRQDKGRRYRQDLAGVGGITLLDQPIDRTHSYYAFSLLVENRKGFIKKLREHDIPTSVICTRIDRHPVFGGKREDLPNQSIWDEKFIALPLHDAITDQDIDHIIKTIRSGW